MNAKRIALTLAALAAGCAHAPQRAEVVWPDPPETPRIRFVTSFAADVDLESGGWSSFRRSLLGEGSATRIRQPMGLAVSDDGQRVYVADVRGQVLRADLAARHLAPFAADEPLEQPMGVALDAQENVYVTDSGRRAVVVFSKDGRKLRSFGKELERPTGIAVDRQRGVVYVSDTARVASENHGVYAFTLEGRIIHEIGGKRGVANGDFNFPTYLAVDDAGNLYVVDSMNFRIQIFDPAGAFVRAYGQQGDTLGTFARPKGLAFDAFGNLYVADGEHAVVQIFNREFQPLMWFGGNAPKVEFMDVPTAIAIDRAHNRIYVANGMQGRVNAYDLINTTAADSAGGAPAPAAGSTAASGPAAAGANRVP